MFGNVGVGEYNCPKTTVGEVCSSIVRGPFGSALKKDFFVSRGPNTVKVYEQKHAIQKDWTLGTYYIDEEKFKELSRFECHGGDFIMSCSGTMGELYQLPDESELGIINQALCKFTLSNKMLPRFFTMAMSLIVQNLQSHGSAINNIAAVKYVKQMAIPLPDIDIQNEFVSFANQVDKSKVLMKKCFEKFDQLVKSRFIEMFGTPTRNEKQWPTESMKSVAPAIQSDNKPKSKGNWLLNLDAIQSNSGEILFKNRVSESEVNGSIMAFSPDHVLYSKLRPYLNKVVVPDEYGFGTTELIPLLPDKLKLTRTYLAHLLRSDAFVSKFSSAVAGTKMPRVTMDVFWKFHVPLPPMSLQEEFAAFVEQVDKSKFIITSKWTISRICCVH